MAEEAAMTRLCWTFAVIVSVWAAQSASAETKVSETPARTSETRTSVGSTTGSKNTTTATTSRAPLKPATTSATTKPATTAATTKPATTAGTTKPTTATTTVTKPAASSSVTGVASGAKPASSVTGSTPRSATVRAPEGVQPGGTKAATSATTTKPAATTTTAKPAAGAAAPSAEYDFGDYTSETLTTKAWEALTAGDYAAVEAYAGKCIDMYEAQAIEQSQSLTDFAPKKDAFNYWALNDVATSHFILGSARTAQGRVKEAQKEFQTVIDKYPFAQCWDPRGWFWHPAEAANDKLSTMGTPYDFGDYTSMTLTVKAWEALGKNDHKGVELYAKKCFELYEAEAKKQQKSLTDFAPKDKAFDYWALNDVGTCYFILGESLLNQKKYPEAKAAYERVINDFGFAQCWDPKGWFWQVAKGSKDKIKKIQVLQQL
jgi:tetratricopeptide (TPR) repeat protein